VMVDETRRPTMLHGREKEDSFARDGRRNSSTYGVAWERKRGQFCA
jgi:hypothetical protein